MSTVRALPAYALPSLVLLLAAALELATPTHIVATPLFAAACVAAGVLLPLRGTVAVVVTAVAVELLIKAWLALPMGPDDWVHALDVPIAGALGVAAHQLRSRYGTRLAAVREVAEAAQRAVLPTPAERLGGIRVAAEYRAAQSGSRIGGDFYAAVDTPHGVRLVVGDVRGKGLGAVGLAAILLGAFRESAIRDVGLEEVALRMDEAAAREAARRGGEDRWEGFATALLVEVSAAEPGRLRLLNCGHASAYLFGADGAVRELHSRRPGSPLGLDMGLLDAVAPEEVELPFDAVVLLLTDGVTEARDAQGTFFDPARHLTATAWGEPAAVLGSVVDAVARWTGGARDDDMALLAFRAG
ncbi:PP2C family protein-serine/threonine phosphatase [Streptomyces sp. NPDC001941]|uniref:PP2C family protein-serine/threonine phosphatase n=1 Tax=Streptomyces sp. NPDC001941 TaxID=3154659 RepID=UPI003330E348